MKNHFCAGAISTPPWQQKKPPTVLTRVIKVALISFACMYIYPIACPQASHILGVLTSSRENQMSLQNISIGQMALVVHLVKLIPSKITAIRPKLGLGSFIAFFVTKYQHLSPISLLYVFTEVYEMFSQSCIEPKCGKHEGLTSLCLPYFFELNLEF